MEAWAGGVCATRNTLILHCSGQLVQSRGGGTGPQPGVVVFRAKPPKSAGSVPSWTARPC